MLLSQDGVLLLGATVWTGVAAVAFTLVDLFSFTHLFVAAFVGFAVLAEVTAPPEGGRNWRSPVRWLYLVGAVGVAYLIVERLVAVAITGLS